MCRLLRGCGWGEPPGTTALGWATPAHAMVGTEARTTFPKELRVEHPTEVGRARNGASPGEQEQRGFIPHV